jgi:hypothetical protein
MEFYGVSKFEIRELGPLPKQVMGFDITDASQRQLEGISYSVEDYENGEIGFNCDEIWIVSAQLCQ